MLLVAMTEKVLLVYFVCMIIHPRVHYIRLDQLHEGAATSRI